MKWTTSHNKQEGQTILPITTKSIVFFINISIHFFSFIVLKFLWKKIPTSENIYICMYGLEILKIKKYFPFPEVSG